ncbi:MAG: pantetheine-phosphate adenylyltransferase [Acholeplasmatales bacterium]|jgi:pantetheine-phosphate adenylyltransferase|nr:pantetheine-phosphate adenylyltransferase [Acholeplasmatales bacterium]
MKKAIYPGTFDPLTTGHLDIIKRSSQMFEELHVVVADDYTKKHSFTEQERVQFIKKCVANFKNVIVSSTNDLVVRYAKENDINIMIRGLRNFADYEKEYQLFQFNRHINSNIETIFLIPTHKEQYVSSSSIKELVKFNADISKFVPKEIVCDVIAKLKKETY